MTDEVRITIAHIREAKLCANGARAWFERYGFSWDDFVTNGKSAAELEATGDPFALQVGAIARKANS